jgi:CrcB protein
VTILVWCGVGALGALGALLRFAVDAQVQGRAGDELPLGTLAVNLSGALALGVLTGAHVGGDALLLAGTGFLGAYTTFSTLMLDSWRLFEDGLPMLAFVNIAGSTVLGLVAVVGGVWLGRSLG